MLYVLAAVCLIFAIAATPLSIWLQARTHQKMIESLFQHLQESQVLGGTTIALERRKAEFQMQQIEKDRDETAARLAEARETNHGRNPEREALS